MPNVGKAKTAVIPMFEDVVIRGENVTAELDNVMNRLKIDGNNLGGEAVEHASLFARIAMIAEEASSEARWAKRRLDLAKAELDGDIRRRAAASGEKKPTEGQIENEIVTDDRISELTEALLDCERVAGITGAVRQSLTHRREMLVELMRDARHENSAYGQGND